MTHRRNFDPAALARVKLCRRRDREQAAHTRAKCALRGHPTLGRYLRQQKNGRLRIDRAKVKAEERLDGKFLLSTSDPNLSADDVALGYKNLLKAERGITDRPGELGNLRSNGNRTGSVVARDNVAWWAARFIANTVEGQTTPSLQGIVDGGGNRFGQDARFDGVGSCGQFRPNAAAALAYGHRARAERVAGPSRAATAVAFRGGPSRPHHPDRAHRPLRHLSGRPGGRPARPEGRRPAAVDQRLPPGRRGGSRASPPQRP